MDSGHNPQSSFPNRIFAKYLKVSYSCASIPCSPSVLQYNELTFLIKLNGNQIADLSGLQNRKKNKLIFVQIGRSDKLIDLKR